jgi:aryl-alcohol dehydrogenase-like predicted oxidoreductase
MQYKELGNTGIFVSRLCLGTMTFGDLNWPNGDVLGGLNQEQVDTLVGRSIDAGINFFDTADVYSQGNSETMLGKALSNNRKDVIISTKVAGRVGSGVNQLGASRVHLLRQVEASLERLNTDYIDLYQIHHFDDVTPLEETLRTLNDLVRSGKVRHIGCSNFAAWQMMKALGISAREQIEKFVTLQAYYSVAGRDLEQEIIPFLDDQKLGLLVWGPLAGGFLSGKYRRGEQKEGKTRRDVIDFPPIDVERGYDIVDVLNRIADRRDRVSTAQVALSWLLHQDCVTSVIVGVKSEQQLKDNLASIEVNLTSEELAEIDAVSKPQQIYPAWMSQMHSDRLPGAKSELGMMMRPTAL